jgi:hypothetical protein
LSFRKRLSAVRVLRPGAGEAQPATHPRRLACRVRGRTARGAPALDNIEAHTTHYALKSGANPGTAKAYRVKAKAMPEEYLEYEADPVNYKPRAFTHRGPLKAESLATAPASNPARTGPTPIEAAAQVPPPAGAAAPAATPAQPSLRSFPLDAKGEDFRFALPAAGLMMKDVARITLHLVTYAKDFDPMNRDHVAWFAMAPRDAAQSVNSG